MMTELVFILDRSGSMSGLERDTVGGFNSMLRKQKTEPGECLVSTLLFDSETAVIHDRIPLDRVPELTREQYCVRGTTALLDAVENQETPRWNLLRGMAYLENGEFAKAARCLTAAEETYPKETIPQLERCSRELEDYKMAYLYACKQK